MKHFPLIVLFTLVFASCNNSTFEKDVIAIKVVMDKQAQCWSSGDIDGFMDGYWKSDSLRFLGRRGLTKGWQTTLDNYKKSYPNPTAMGTLKFTHISFESFNNNMLVVGKWALYREKDTLSGYYSLIWRKIDKNWKVVFDHTN